MSLKYEQYRALRETQLFLRDILRGPRSPQLVLKQRASRCLHHFPFLRKTGEPMFSKDEFPCPELED